MFTAEGVRYFRELLERALTARAADPDILIPDSGVLTVQEALEVAVEVYVPLPDVAYIAVLRTKEAHNQQDMRRLAAILRKETGCVALIGVEGATQLLTFTDAELAAMRLRRVITDDDTPVDVPDAGTQPG